MLRGHNAYKHYLELIKKKCRCDLLDDSSTSSGPILPHIIQWHVYLITNPVNRAAPKGQLLRCSTKQEQSQRVNLVDLLF